MTDAEWDAYLLQNKAWFPKDWDFNDPEIRQFARDTMKRRLNDLAKEILLRVESLKEREHGEAHK